MSFRLKKLVIYEGCKYLKTLQPNTYNFLDNNSFDSFLIKNRHKAQRKAKFYINKCRSASCMQSGWKRTPA